MPTSLIDRIKQRMNASGAGFDALPPKAREKSRKIVRTNRFDDAAYAAARKTAKVGDLVHELMEGDEQEARPEFETAPELVEAVFQMAYKAAPEIEHRRRLSRDLYYTRRICEEIQNNPRLQDLHEFTEGDTTLSVVAVDAMGPMLKEIISRVPEEGPQAPDGQPGGGQGGGGGQPDPNAPQGGQGGGGGGQPGQPGQHQGQGGGAHNGQDPQAGGDGGAGQDPAGGGGAEQGDGGEDGQNGPPPPPEEKMAEEGDGSEYDQDLNDDDSELDLDTELEEQEAAWEKAWDNILDDLNLDRLANKALEAAHREAEELDNLRKGIGLEDGVWAVMDPTERLALAETMRTGEMKDLANIIGRMKRFALGVKATRIVDVNHEAYNVETGNDLRRVLRHQFAYLAPGPYHDITKLEFYRRYADKELLQFKMRGSEDVGKGPIVMAIDKSGSMNGQPFHWALAVAEALRRFAADEDRDMYVIFFGNNSDRVRFEFPKGKAPWEKILTFLGTVANGGTQFDGVLTEALQRATDQFDGEGKEKADIVFVTDGMANLADDWINSFNKERKRVGVRVYSVYIGGSYDYGHTKGPLGLLDRISDATIPVSELKPEDAQQIFAKV